MKKIALLLTLTASIWSSGMLAQTKNPEQVKVNIDLVNIKDDKVAVTLVPPKTNTDIVVYHLPKTVPGTYSADNYGRYIDEVKALDAKGKELTVTKTDANSWSISGAKNLAKLTYLVNDTFDTEKGSGFGKEDIFSPAGSNIEKDENIMLNTHCFVGYFDGKLATPYQVTIDHSAKMWGATSMTDADASETKDVFTTSRYAELVENPIMYAKQNKVTFTVNGMEILLAVYSPTGVITAESILPDMKRIMTAQKTFLGSFNSTKKYSVLLYLSDVKKQDAKGFGALEHPTATTVVMPEMMGKEQLAEQLKDVVSHEFFHIVTPLTIHAKEIQDFDYNKPKMSEHLWMYEGVTEYFANLFQINQGLITEDEFYKRMAGKIEHSASYNDAMPFTTMSANVLENPYKDQYTNVYEKGALIGMCVDIIIREKSDGKRGILDLMQNLSLEYGVNKAFNDSDLFAKITALTYPEVGEFLKTYVAGPTSIPYEVYFTKMGVTKSTVKEPENVFLKGQVPYITVNQETKEILVRSEIELNDFMKTIGLQPKDVIAAINGNKYNLDNIYEMVTSSQSWKDGDAITIGIMRDGKEQTLTGKVKLSFADATGFEFKDETKAKLKNAWLKE